MKNKPPPSSPTHYALVYTEGVERSPTEEFRPPLAEIIGYGTEPECWTSLLYWTNKYPLRSGQRGEVVLRTEGLIVLPAEKVPEAASQVAILKVIYDEAYVTCATADAAAAAAQQALLNANGKASQARKVLDAARTTYKAVAKDVIPTLPPY